MADLDAEIEQAAKDPKSVTVDGETVQSRDIDELIKADRYLAGKTAAAKAKAGIRFTKLVPGGAAGTPTQQ